MPLNRVTPLVLLSLAVVLAAVTGARGEDQRNAATWYRKAYARLDWVTEAQWQMLSDYNLGQPPAPTSELRALLAKMTPMLNDFRRGAASPYCDWELDYSQGFELEMPHLWHLRRMTRAVAADARMRLYDGDAHGAADRIASIYRLSGQNGSDRILIGSLVGMAVNRLGEQTADVGLDRGLFNPTDTDLMLRPLKEMEPTDPYNVLEAMFSEQEIAVSWIDQIMGTQEQRDHITEETGWLGRNDERAAALGDMTDEEFSTQLTQYDLMMDTVVEAFMQEDPAEGRAMLEKIYAGVEAGEFGTLAQIITPSFMKVFDQKIQSAEDLAARIELLEKIASGEINLEDEINAAIHYLRGIEMLRELDAEAFQQVCEFEAGRVKSMDETLGQTLDTAQEALEQFRIGSLKRRCDFSYLRSDGDPQFFFDYIAGMCDALRVLRADTIRQFRAGDVDAAVERLCVSYRVIGHFSGDTPLLSARTAHDAFRRTGILLVEAMESDRITDEQRGLLRPAANQIARKDPFGYIAATIDSRQRMTRALQHRLARLGCDEDAKYQSLARNIQHLDGDAALYYLAIRDTMQRAARRKSADETASAEAPDRLARLEGVIDLDALARVRKEVPQVAPFLAESSLDFYHDREITKFARCVEHARRARDDLRNVLRLLRAAPTADEEPAPGDSSN